jgi:hypothetical protein
VVNYILRRAQGHDDVWGRSFQDQVYAKVYLKTVHESRPRNRLSRRQRQRSTRRSFQSTRSTFRQSIDRLDFSN